MTSKEALEIIIFRLTSHEEDLELRETDKKAIEIIKHDLERLERLEIENRNNEKVVADGVKLMNRNLELQSRLEALEKENKEVWENIEKYNHKFAEVERKKCDLIQENEKLKNAIENEIELLRERRFTAYACDDYVVHSVLNTIIEELKEVLGDEMV